jgi:hypothetical protein
MPFACLLSREMPISDAASRDERAPTPRLRRS